MNPAGVWVLALALSVIFWIALCASTRVPRSPLLGGTDQLKTYVLLHSLLVSSGAVLCLSLVLLGVGYLPLFWCVSLGLAGIMVGMQEGSSLGNAYVAFLEKWNVQAMRRNARTGANASLREDNAAVTGSAIEQKLLGILEAAVQADADRVRVRCGENRKARVALRIGEAKNVMSPVPPGLVAAFVKTMSYWSRSSLEGRSGGTEGGVFEANCAGDSHLFAYRASGDGGSLKLTIDLLSRTHSLVSGGLPTLGLTGGRLEAVRASLGKPSGLIIVCGPRRAGKSTTALAMLSELPEARRPFAIIERYAGLTSLADEVHSFHHREPSRVANCLREISRRGPGVVMLEELDSLEEVDAVLHLASLEHLVIVTVPSASAHAVVRTLQTKTSSGLLLNAALLCVVEQRLVPRLCRECRRKVVLTYADREFLGLNANRSATPASFHPGECVRCNHTGYRGRIGLFGVMDGRSHALHASLNSSRESSLPSSILLENALIQEDAAEKILAGECTLHAGREMLEKATKVAPKN